jgi:Fe-S-cluster containining protein
VPRSWGWRSRQRTIPGRRRFRGAFFLLSFFEESLLPNVFIETAFDKIRFQCQRCGACCYHKRPREFDDLVPLNRLKEFVEKSNLIYLTEEDIETIGRRVQSRPEEFVDTLYPYDGRFVKIRDSGRSVVLDLPVMKSREDNSCVFYESTKGCAIYSLRPKACRLFPFRVEEETTEAGDALLRIGYNPTCPGIGRGKVADKGELKRLVAEQFLSRARSVASEVQELRAKGLVSLEAEIFRTLPGRRASSGHADQESSS